MNKFTKNALTIMASLALITPLASGITNTNAKLIKRPIKNHYVIRRYAHSNHASTYRLGERYGKKAFIRGYSLDVIQDLKLENQIKAHSMGNGSFWSGFNRAYRVMPWRKFASHVHKTYPHFIYNNGTYLNYHLKHVTCLKSITFAKHYNKATRETMKNYTKYSHLPTPNKMNTSQKKFSNWFYKNYEKDYAHGNEYNMIKEFNFKHHKYNGGREIKYIKYHHSPKSEIVVIYTGMPDSEEASPGAND